MSGPPWYEMPLLPAALPDGRAALSTARGAAWDPRAGTICFGSVVRAWSPECDDGVAPAGAAIAAVTSAAAPAANASLRSRRRVVRAGMGPPSDNEVGGRPFVWFDPSGPPPGYPWIAPLRPIGNARVTTWQQPACHAGSAGRTRWGQVAGT